MVLLDYANVSAEDNKLFNHDFDDIYHQPDAGFAESNHTFIHANDLPLRFQRLSAGQSFTIGEIGFGSGLNFINSVQHFFANTHCQPHHSSSLAAPSLIYCSVEKHPIALNTLLQIQHDWPLAPIRAALYAQYPHNHPGVHCLQLHPQLRLLLLMGDATDMLRALKANVDAWFLDGFAPAKNPACWSQNLFKEIARCSHAQTTLSSFSAARVLREHLQHSGFVPQKRAGHGQKRDMICASFNASTSLADQSVPHWTDLAAPIQPSQLAGAKRVAVIGGGIAGATTANALAREHFTVDVYHDPQAYPAASAVPLAVPYLQPALKGGLLREYQLNAWHHALRRLHALVAHNADILHPCTIIRQPENAKERQRLQQLFTQGLLNDRQWAFHDPDIHYLQAGVVQPLALLDTLLTHERIHVHAKSIHSIEQVNRQWRVGDALYDVVVLATGWQTSLYPDNLIKQSLRPIRGQGTFLSVAAKPKAIFCDRHAFIPHPTQNIVYAGSSFSPNDTDLTHREQDDRDNQAAYLDKFARNLLDNAPTANVVDSFVGIRCAVKDYQPLLGPMPIEANVIETYQPWRKDSRLPIHQAIKHYPGLYVNAGYGAKGMTNAFLNAEVLTAMISAQPLPIDKALLPHILPARIIIKQLIRRQC